MDFNQILLFAGLGLLAIVLLFALWGFLGGLKRELRCVAVFIVLLVLSWLVFGDQATLLNVKAGQQVAEILGVQDDSISTIWDAILVYAKSVIPNGEGLLVEGKETYTLFYSVVGAIFRAVGLFAGTLVVLIVSPIIRLITHMIELIIRAAKKKKPVEQAASEKTVVSEKEQVVISTGEESVEEAVVTKEANELVKKPAGKKRWWGALAGSLKGVFVVILVCVPLSGICTVLNTATPETKGMISDLVNGKEQQTTSTDDPIEMIFDFAKAYDESGLGKFANASSYFFGKSFSESLFDDLLRIETKNQNISVSEELITFIKAANALNGKSNPEKWSIEELKTALNALKKSKLLVEGMPVAIEYGYEIPAIQKALENAYQDSDYLSLRYINWGKDLDAILDAIVEAYQLGIFPLDQFNYLTMNAEQVRNVVNVLAKTELIQKILPIAINTGLSHEKVVEWIGYQFVSGIEDIDWKKELNILVDMYATFQTLGVTSFEGLDTNALIKDILNNVGKTEALFEIINQALEVELLKQIAVPSGIEYASNIEGFKKLLEDADQFGAFSDLRFTMTIEDLKAVVAGVKTALPLIDFSNYPTIQVDYLNLDVAILHAVVDQIFSTLDEETKTSSLYDVVKIGLAVGLNQAQVKEIVGDALDQINFTEVNWKQEFHAIVNIYEEVQKFDLKTIENVKENYNNILHDILNDSNQLDDLLVMVHHILSLQIADLVVVPVGIDYALHQEQIRKLLEDAKQLEAVEKLKETLTTDDLKKIVSAVREAANLANFEEFPNRVTVDYLHLDATILRSVVNKLFSSQRMNEIINIAVTVGVSIEKVQDMTKHALDNVDFSQVVWDKELGQLVSLYETFLTFGFESVEEFQTKNWIEIVQDILENADKFESANTFASQLVDLQLYKLAGTPTMQKFLDEFIDQKANEFGDIVDVNGMSSEEWKEDLKDILDIAKAANEIKVLDNLNPFVYQNLDLTSDQAIANLKLIVEKALGLHILGDNQLKNKLVLASMRQFGWIEVLEEDAFQNVDWNNETIVILSLIDTYAKLIDVEGFDIYNLSSLTENIEQLLENDTFLDYVVEALENIVESQLVLTVLPNVLDKYLVPQIEKLETIDDSALIKDILDHISSEELVNEVIKLVDVVKAAVDLNVLDIKNDGLHALALEQVDAMKTIVSGIFDSKIIQGFEGRIIRLLLKVSGLLDIEKDGDVYNQLIALDYTGEKDILLSFIDEISNVLQDESFTLFNEQNQLILDLNFWAENENAQALVNGVKVLFGTYEDTNVSGSKLIEVLLPTIYDTYVEAKNIIPEDFKSIVEELDVTNASGQTLAHDLRCLVYVLDQLVSVDAQTFLTKEGNIAINDQLSDALCNIIDALHDMELFWGHEEATLSWGVNYIASLLKIELGAINEDFSNVDWQGQKAVYKNIITDIVALFKENQVADVNAAIEIIQGILKGNHEYDTYVTDANATSILNIIDKIADVEVIDAIIPLGIKYGVKFLGEKGIQLDYIYELTNEQLVADFHSLVTIAHKLVEDLSIVDYYLDREKGEMALPNESVVLSLVDDIYDLNLVQCANGRLAEAVYDKLIELYAQDQVFELSKADFDFRNINWTSEKEVIKELLALGYDFFETANVQTMYAVVNFFKDKWYTYPTVLTDEVGYIATEALRTLQQSQLVGNIIEKSFTYLVNLANRSGQVPFSIDYLAQVSKEALIEDLGTLANILDEAISFGAIEYFRTKNIQMVDLNKVADIFEHMYDLNIVQANESELLFNAINYGLKLINDKWNDTLFVTDSQVKAIDVKQEFTLVAQIIRNVQRVLDKQDLRSITDIQEFISGDAYKKEAFYDVETGEILSDILVEVVDSQILQLVLVDVIDLVATQVKKFDLSFLKGALTKEEWVEDIRTVAKLIVPAIQAELIKLVFGLDVKELPLHMDIYSEMVPILGDLNLLNYKWADIATLATNQVLEAIKVEDRVESSLFEGIVFKDEVASLVQAIQSLQQSFENASIVKVQDVIDIMQYKAYKDAKYANEAVVNPLLDALDALLDTQTLQVVLPTVANVARDQLTKNDATKDFAFVLEDLNQVELVQDAKLLVAYLKDAVTVGALEYVTTQDIQNLNVEKIAEMVDGLYDFHMIQKHAPNLMNELFKLATKKVVISFNVTLADFETIQYQNEFSSLAEAILTIRPLMDSLEYTSLKDVMQIINNKDYQYRAFYKGATLDALVDLARETLDLETVALLLPDAFNYGLDQVKGVDVSFLKDAFTKEELVHDARQILLAVAPMDRAEMIDVMFGTKIEDTMLHFNDYEEIVTVVSELYILNKKWADIAALATNKILEALKSSDRVESNLFEGIVFKDEALQLVQVLENLDQTCLAANLSTVKNVIDIVKDGYYKDVKYANEAVVNPLLEALEVLLDVQTVQVLLPTATTHIITYLDTKHIQYVFMLEDLNQVELVQDAKLLVAYLKDAVTVGVLEYITTKDIQNLNVEKIAEMVDGLYDFHMIQKHIVELLSTVVETLDLAIKDIVIDITSQDLETVDYALEFKQLAEVVRGVGSLMDSLEYTSLKDLTEMIKRKDYNANGFYTEASVNAAANILDAVANLQLAEIVLPSAIDYAVVYAASKNLDLAFLQNGRYNGALQVEDLKTMATILPLVYELGITDYYFKQEGKDLDATIINAILDQVGKLNVAHLFYKDLLVLGVNKVYSLAKLDAKVTVEDFNSVVFETEIETFQKAVVAFKAMMDEKELSTIADVVAFFNDKTYAKAECYDVSMGYALATFVSEIADSKVVEVMLPVFFNYGLDQVKGVDVSFLKDVFTKEELSSDLKQLSNAIVPIIRAELVDVCLKAIQLEEMALHFNDYEEIVTVVSELHILNKKWADIAALTTNKILEALKSSDRVEASLFEGIIFKDEAPQLVQALEEFKAAYVSSNVLTVKDILDIFKNKNYKDEATLNRNVVNAFVNGVDQAVEVKTLQVLLPTFAMHMAKFIGQKGFAMEYLFIDATKEELVADVHTLASMTRELLDYGMLEFMLFGGAIDVSTADVINAAIDKMQTLHCMNHNEQNLLTALFDKLGINTTSMALSTIDYKQTWAEVNEVVRIAYRVFNAKQADTLSQIKALFTKEFVQELWKVNEQTDTYLDAMIDLAKLCSESELVEAIAFPVSEKYVKEDNKLFDLIGIHQIYNHPQEFTADLSAFATTIESIRTLDLYKIVKEDAPYPFDRSDVVETVVNHLFGLYYFNNDGRLDAVIKAVDGLVSQDLSDITADGVNLKADAPKIIEMYSYFYNITQNKYWTINSNADVKNKNFNMQLLGQASFYENTLDFILTYMDTTIYEKTGPAILLVSVPLMKKFAPQYYEALDLEHLTLDVVEHDILYLEDIIFAMKEMDLTTTIENKAYFTEQMREMVTRIFDDVVALDMLNGHMEAVLTLIAKDFINGKKIAGFEIAEDAFKFETTIFELDKDDIKLVMNELYDLFARENINNIEDVKAYIQQLMNKAGMKAFLSQESNWVMMENIMNALSHMTLVQENGLAMMNNIVTPFIEQYSLTLGHASDLSMYTNEEFMEDLALATALVKALHQLDVVSILNNQDIDYANVDAVETILSSLADMNYFKYHMDQIINFVDRRSILPFSIQALHSSEFDFASDMRLFAQMYKDLVPYLTSKYNPFPTYKDIRAFMNSGFNITKDMLSGTNQYRYNFVDAYDKLVQTTTYQLLLPELKEFVETKVPEKYRGVVAAVSFDGLTFAQVKEDALLSATLVRTLVDFGIIDVVKNKDIPFTGQITSTLDAQTTEITRTEALNNIVDYLEALHCLDNRSEVLLEALETLGVITNEIDLSGVNWENEFTYLRTLITEGIEVFESCGWNTVKEVYAYIKSLNRTNIQSEMKAMARLADTDSLAVVMETLDLSDAFNQLFKPLYNRYVYHRLPISLSELGNLDEYTIADLDEDMARVARITRAVAQMDAVPGSIKDNVTKDECIIPAQTIIEEVFALNFVDQKKQELVHFANTFVGKIDMSDLDLTGVDLASDGKILSAYAKEILMIVAKTGLLKVKLQHLGNTELMSAFVALYHGALDTNVFKAISSWGYEKYVLPKLENANLAHRLGIDENSIEPLCQEFGVVLDALLDMGAFSNEGIDFTNPENTDRLFGVFTNVFDLSDKTMTPINKLKKNMYVLGKVDLVYPEGSLKVELKAIYHTMMKALDLVERYGDQLKTDKYELLDDQSFQNEVTALVNQAFESKVLEQIAMPIADGIVRIFTKDIVEITILEHMDSKTFVNTFLPDVFNIVEKANALGLFKKTIDYKNAQGIIDFADIAVHSTSFAPYLDQLMQYACYVVGIDIRDVDFSSVNWEMEYQGLASALREMETVLPTIDIHDKSTMKNNAFLDAVANATPHMENSTILPLVARQFAEKLAQKLFGNRFNQYINRLYQTSYTDEKLMSDYAHISDILKAVVDLGYFEGGLDYNDLDPILILAEEFFALEYTKGLEATLLNAVVKRVDALKAYTFDFDAVQDWAAEQVVLMDALKELVSLSKLMDINNVSSSALENKEIQAQFVKVVDAMSKSLVGQQFLPQFYMDKVEPMLGNEDYRDIVDFTDPGFTPDKWAGEFEKLFEAYSKLQEVGYGTSKEITLQDAKAIMLLMFGTREHKEDGLYAVTSKPQLWLTRFYDRGFFSLPNNAKVSIDTTDDRDWNDEAYQMMDLLDQMMAFETSSGSTFDYNDVYACQDEAQLKEFFATINECVAVRTAVMCIVFNVIEENTTVQQQLEASGLLDTAFQDEYDLYMNGTYVYNESYWTDAKVQQFASIIARANAL